VKFTIEDANKYFTKNKLVPSVTLEAEESDIPAVTGAKLKEFIRKKAKTTALPDQIARDLEKTLSI